MKNSDHSSGKQSLTPKSLPNWLIWTFIAVSFLGFLDASYLTVQHYAGYALNCSILEGCEEVTTSKYSLLFGVPVALLGIFYYLTVLICSLLYLDTKNAKIIGFLRVITVFGLLASIWFVYAQIALIKALCEYCMLSAITSTVLFILSIITLKYSKNEKILP